ncbi:hypothetical protein P7C70_g4551, partial [Phenoliferia sp. Uapishka_3]
MVLSKSPFAPTVIVVGITGKQGGSVARALIASSKPYRVIGLTRDTFRPSAKEWVDLGVELRQVAIGVGNEVAVQRAFEGADVLFAVTNFDEHGDKAREIAEGKLMVDAALSSSIHLFIWSSLVSISTLSSGKYTKCEFFDAKAEVTSYLAKSGLPWANVPCGFYISNLIASPYKFSRSEKDDDSYVLRLPVKGETKIPVLDPKKDYGEYVLKAIEGEGMGAGSEILSGKLTSFKDIVEGLSKATGKTITFQEVDGQTFLRDVLDLSHLGPIAFMVLDMFLFFNNFGCKTFHPVRIFNKFRFDVACADYGNKDVEASQAAAGIVPRTLEETLSTYEGPMIV